jgi:eukaryotic-like serine/threonine-protein kinase
VSTVPERVGRYRVVRALGTGGIGEVFVAIKDGSSTPVALKRLRPEMHAHESALPRLKREAHLISMIDHPHIARILDAGMEDNAFCVATELIQGKDLESFIAKKIALPLPMVVAVAAAILRALEAAHELRDPEGRAVGLVHRDLAPKNVMLGFDGAVKVIDFGIARGSVDRHQTAAGTVIGTPTHLSPEQASGLEVDARSDLYTVGVVLHEMLTGERMVKGRTAIESVLIVIREAATDPCLIEPRTPPELGRVVLRALQKDPKARFQSAQEFNEALRSATAIPAWSAKEIGTFVRQAFPPATEEEIASAPTFESTRTAAEMIAPPRPQRSRLWLALPALAIVLAVLAAIPTRRPPAPTPPPPPPPAVVEPAPAFQPSAVQRADEAPVYPRPPPKHTVRTPKPAPPIAIPTPPPKRDVLTPMFDQLRATAERGALDLDLAQVILQEMERRSDSPKIGDARICLKMCATDTQKIRSLAEALESVKASRR